MSQTEAAPKPVYRPISGIAESLAAIEEVVGAIAQLETLKSVRRLMDLLRAGDEMRARRSA